MTETDVRTNTEYFAIRLSDVSNELELIYPSIRRIQALEASL